MILAPVIWQPHVKKSPHEMSKMIVEQLDSDLVCNFSVTTRPLPFQNVQTFTSAVLQVQAPLHFLAQHLCLLPQECTLRST